MGQRNISFQELLELKLQGMIERIEIKGEGVSTAPPFDLEAIQQRAMSLDGNSQVATDIYQLIRQVKQLQAALDAKT